MQAIIHKKHPFLVAALVVLTLVLTCALALGVAASQVTTELTAVQAQIRDGVDIKISGTIAPADASKTVEVKYTFDGGEEITVIVTPDADDTFSFIVPVGPGQMNGILSVNLYVDGEAKYTEDKTTSVKAYCDYQLQNSDDAALKTLVSDLLVYGAQALRYLGNEEDAKALLTLPAGATLSCTPYTAPTVLHKSYDGDVFTKISMTLTNRLALTAKDENDQGVKVDNISFRRVWTAQSITDADGKTLTYSITSYIDAMDDDEKAGELVRAMYSVALSLEEYVGHTYTYVKGTDTHHRVCAVCGAAEDGSTEAHEYTSSERRETLGSGACADTLVYGVCVCGAESLQKRVGSCAPHNYTLRVTNLSSTGHTSASHTAPSGTLTYTCTACDASYTIDALSVRTFDNGCPCGTVYYSPVSGQTDLSLTYTNGAYTVLGPVSPATINEGQNVCLVCDPAKYSSLSTHMVIGYEMSMPQGGVSTTGVEVLLRFQEDFLGKSVVNITSSGAIQIVSDQGSTTVGQLTAGVMTRIMMDMTIIDGKLVTTLWIDEAMCATAAITIPDGRTQNFSGTSGNVQFKIARNEQNAADTDRGIIIDNLFLSESIPELLTVPFESTSHGYEYVNNGETHSQVCTQCGDAKNAVAHTYDRARTVPKGSGACAAQAVYHICSACGAETYAMDVASTVAHDFGEPNITGLSEVSHTSASHVAPSGKLTYACKNCEYSYQIDALSLRTFNNNCPCGTLYGSIYEGKGLTLSYTDKTYTLIGPVNSSTIDNHACIVCKPTADSSTLLFGYEVTMPQGGVSTNGFDTVMKINGSWIASINKESDMIVHIDSVGAIFAVHADGSKTPCGQLTAGVMSKIMIYMTLTPTSVNYTVWIDGVPCAATTRTNTNSVTAFATSTELQLKVGRSDANQSTTDANRGIIVDNVYFASSMPSALATPLHVVHTYDPDRAVYDGDEIVFTCSECLLTERVPSVVNYDDFGAVGDGVTDDSAAIRKAHEFANRFGLDVTATAGKTYYIGVLESAIEIRTNTDWNGAKLIFDDSLIAYNDARHRNVNVFHVVGTASQMVTVPNGMTLSKGQTNIGITFDAPCMLKIENSGEKIYIREGVNANSGVNKQEYILVDASGNVDPSTPIQYDYAAVTAITRYSIDDKAITVGNGTIETRVTDPKATNPDYDNYEGNYSYCYFARGILVTRSNATVSNIVHRITGEDMVDYVDRDGDGTYEVYGDDKPYGVPYSGFFNFQNNYNATMTNCEVQGHQAYNFYQGSSRNEMGSYDLSATGTIGLKLLYITQYENADTQETITNRTMYHGVMGSNFCRNIVMDHCYLDRFDSHQGLHNATITNSTLGFGILVIGGGQLYVENVTRISGTYFILLREDYNSTFEGDIIIKNCTAEAGITTLIKGRWVSHNLGLPNYMGKNITVDGLNIKYTGMFYVYNISNATAASLTDTVNPFFAPSSVSVTNLTYDNTGLLASDKLTLCGYNQKGAFANTTVSTSNTVRQPSYGNNP